MADKDIKKYFDEKSEETKRHFDVVAEKLTHEIQFVAEGVSSNGAKIDRMQSKLEEHDKRFDILEVKMVKIERGIVAIKSDMNVMKPDISVIK